MLKYILKRLGISALILLSGSLLLFVLTINSGDPLEDLRESSAENREQLILQRIHFMELDHPWYERYWNWFTGAIKCFTFQCDLGTNAAGQRVTALIADAASSTLRLVLVATFLSIFIGVTLGIVSAVRQYSGFDYAVTLMAFIFFSLPVFWVGVLLKHYAAIRFNNWLPDASLSPKMIALGALFAGFVVQAAMGGGRNRRLPTFAIVTAATAALLYYFDVVQWFRRPSIGLPIYILAVAGAAVLLIVLVAGFGNKGVRNSVGATALSLAVGYALMRPELMNYPTWTKILLTIAGGVGLALVLSTALGGFARRQARLGSVSLALFAAFIGFVDLVLSNWASFINIQPRPMATIGSVTPNFEGNFWEDLLDKQAHIALPTVALTLISIAGYTRYTRAAMLDVLNQDYIRTARSKGISERNVIVRHALRNSLIPLATIVAFDFAGMISGALITEQVFGWQGMGNLFMVGLRTVDPGPVMGFYLVTGTAAVVMNMLADIAYAVLDPRITQ